ncbi:MAG TPA: metallophosphoesterase family protein, partial [Verrucomicrobiae bacterium]
MHRSLKSICSLCCGLLGLSGLARFEAFATTEEIPVFARAPYLQFATTNSIYVVWRTMGSVSPAVRFGQGLRQLTEQTADGDIKVRAALGTNGQPIPAKWERLRTEENLTLPKLHSAPIGTFQYEARLSDLQPATRYYYAVFDGERRLTPADESYSFVTPPPAGARRPIRFWVLGDGGTGRQPQADVYKAMLNHLQRDHHPLDFWIHVGDMAYGTGRDMEFQSRFFESYEPSLRSSVCWPAMGNHEGFTSKGTTGIGPYYDAYVVPRRGEAGGVASGTEAYYAFDHGNIHFICLDSHDLERKPTGAMAKWLKADLEKTKAEWVIAFWHHPPYTKGSHDSDKEKDLTEMRQHIMPIIDSGGVDLVLTGHSHIYERSMLIDGAYATPTVAENVVLDDGDGDPQGDGPYHKSEGIHPHEGTVQIVAGNAGQTASRNGTLPLMRKTILEHGSVIVDVYGDTLTAIMVNRAGKTRDLVSIVKRGKVEPARIALPWQPAEYKKNTNETKAAASPPIDYKVLIPKNAQWQYLAGQHPRGLDWTLSDFDATVWQTGTAGFGFGDCEFRTELTDMRGKPASVYLRKEFNIEQADRVTELGLMVNYLDGFVAYVNGREVARNGVGRSSGRNAQKIKAREERTA